MPFPLLIAFIRRTLSNCNLLLCFFARALCRLLIIPPLSLSGDILPPFMPFPLLIAFIRRTLSNCNLLLCFFARALSNCNLLVCFYSRAVLSNCNLLLCARPLQLPHHPSSFSFWGHPSSVHALPSADCLHQAHPLQLQLAGLLLFARGPLQLQLAGLLLFARSP